MSVGRKDKMVSRFAKPHLRFPGTQALIVGVDGRPGRQT
jgi:hypothetical protein